MRIQAVRSFEESMPLLRPYTIASRTTSDAHMLFVEIRTDDGNVGRGCAAPEQQITGESMQMCRAALDAGALDWLRGQRVGELNRLLRNLAERSPSAPAARAAVDMALHDLLAQSMALPLVDLLGRAHMQLATSITIGIKDSEATLVEAQEYLDRGFRVLKVKLGKSLEQDVERLSLLRERFGGDVVLRVDPNQGYDARTLKHFVQRTNALDLEFLEQPMPAADTQALRALPASLREHIAADESLLDERDALALLTPTRACGIFNIKLMKCGGIRPALRIASLAETAGVALMWGCMDESRISISAALHAAFASPATRYLDLDGSLDLARDIVDGGFHIEGGIMRTLDRPGLGVRPIQ